MKRLPLLIPLLFFVSFACSDAVTEPEMTPDGSTSVELMAGGGGKWVESITGSGHFVTKFPAYVVGVWRNFTLTAKKAMDGSVTGKYQIVVHVEDGPPTVYRGPISCFTIVGNTAWVGAHIPGNTPTDIAFQVVDNGEGSGTPPDKAGLFVEAEVFQLPAGFAQWFCDATPVFIEALPAPWNQVPIFALLSDVVAGNIQIKGD